jgi:hypothetical protein
MEAIAGTTVNSYSAIRAYGPAQIQTGGGQTGGHGISAEADGPDAIAISASTNGTNATSMRATASGSGGVGMYAQTAPGAGHAIYGLTNSSSGHGVYGYTNGSGSSTSGVRGQSNSTSSDAVRAVGNFSTTGTKNFVQPHPHDPSQAIVFSCLEGNESGTYFRGQANLNGGVAELAIPEEWKLVSDAERITVHLTPIRSFSRLAAWEVSRDRIVVRGTEDCEFTYVVNGVRRGFTEHQPYVTSTGMFQPEVLGIPFGAQYPEALRLILVQNGLLLEDFTPNPKTAAALGWALRLPTQEEMQNALVGGVRR